MDGNGAIRLALKLRERFDTPAEMFAALKADMVLSEDVAGEIGTLALDSPDPNALAWLAAVFYAAGRINSQRASRSMSASDVDSVDVVPAIRSAT
jgi:hypothetical protein